MRLTYTSASAYSSARRLFSTHSRARAYERAIAYTSPGDPSAVLHAVRLPPLRPPVPYTVNIRFILAPINPADINVVQGAYPSKPTLREDINAFVGGNEGLAEVLDVGGTSEAGLERGDWVVMVKPQAGTWTSAANVGVGDVIKVPRMDGLSAVHAATMTVNPVTAHGLLKSFVNLSPGDWIVQNGANSAVGQCVIQLAKHFGYNTLNLVRPRDDLSALTEHLKRLGATQVITYADLAAQLKSLRSEFKSRPVRLGLNCVSNQPETGMMASLLSPSAHLVSYGAMAKTPLSLPTSLFIFKDLILRGYWQTRWYETHSKEEREKVMRTLSELMANGTLREPEHEIVELGGSDEDVTQTIRKIVGRQSGKKVLLKWTDTD